MTSTLGSSGESGRGDVSRWLRVRVGVDRIAACVLACLVGPVVGVAVVVVRVRDGRPSLIRLDRVGAGGTVFRMWKIRTMRSDTADGTASGPSLTSPVDERLTRTGGWLRRQRVDELPQLINVVAGSMSLIGPRPETPDQVDVSDARWRAVLRARPGIVGATQLLVEDIERSAAIHSDQWVALYEGAVLRTKLTIDQWYVENASLRIDFLIVVSLLERFILRQHRTALHRAKIGMLPDLVDSVEALASELGSRSQHVASPEDT